MGMFDYVKYKAPCKHYESDFDRFVKENPTPLSLAELQKLISVTTDYSIRGDLVRLYEQLLLN